jgi:hypothetical protein
MCVCVCVCVCVCDLQFMMNPFAIYDAPIVSPQFDTCIRSAVRNRLNVIG